MKREIREIVERPYARIVEQGEDGVFTASLLEIPGAIAEGDSYAEALENLDEGLPDLIAVMVAQGQAIPTPVSQQRYSGRLQLRLTPSLHARAALYAQHEGVSLNRVLSDAVASYVGMGGQEASDAPASPRRGRRSPAAR